LLTAGEILIPYHAVCIKASVTSFRLELVSINANSNTCTAHILVTGKFEVYNAEKMQEHGHGLGLSVTILRGDDVYKNIENIIPDTSEFTDYEIMLYDLPEGNYRAQVIPSEVKIS
jgi:hypothetical protein